MGSLFGATGLLFADLEPGQGSQEHQQKHEDDDPLHPPRHLFCPSREKCLVVALVGGQWWIGGEEVRK